MPFKPGQSGNPSGRPKSKVPRVDEQLAKLNIDPITELLKLLPECKADTKAKVWLELISYCQAKPKHDADDLQGIAQELAKLSREELVKIAQENIPEFKRAS